MKTLRSLANRLKRFDPDAALVFTTSEGDIGAGYHVTELRHGLSKGIDCGGNVEASEEARLQLLDGKGTKHMSVGKFVDIVEKSLFAVPQLAEPPLMVEFAHGNNGLSLMLLEEPEVEAGQVVLNLRDARAVCKPAMKARAIGASAAVCCGGKNDDDLLGACCA